MYRTLRELQYERSEGAYTSIWDKGKKRVVIGPVNFWFFIQDDFGNYQFDSKMEISQNDFLDAIKEFDKEKL
jgi:hypothetical protein